MKSIKIFHLIVAICSAIGATLLLLFCNNLNTTLISIGLMWTAIMSTKVVAEHDRK